MWMSCQLNHAWPPASPSPSEATVLTTGTKITHHRPAASPKCHLPQGLQEGRSMCALILVSGCQDPVNLLLLSALCAATFF